MTDPIPARVAALKTMPMPELKAQWRELFETDPPPLQPAPPREPDRLPHPGAGLRRAEAGDDAAAGDPRRAVRRATTSPPAASGMTPGRSPAPGWSASTAASSTPSPCLPTATSGRAGPTARSRRSPARSPARGGMAGLLWRQAAGERGMTKPITRKLRCAVYTRKSHRGGAGAGVQQPARPARGLRGLRRQPALRGLGADPRALRRRRLLRRHAGAARR